MQLELCAAFRRAYDPSPKGIFAWMWWGELLPSFRIKGTFSHRCVLRIITFYWIAISTFAAQATPSLISLVKRADAVLNDVLVPDAQLLCLTTYFDEAVHVKVSCHTLVQVFVQWLTWNSVLSRRTTCLLSKKNSSRHSRLLSTAGLSIGGKKSLRKLPRSDSSHANAFSWTFMKWCISFISSGQRKPSLWMESMYSLGSWV